MPSTRARTSDVRTACTRPGTSTTLVIGCDCTTITDTSGGGGPCGAAACSLPPHANAKSAASAAVADRIGRVSGLVTVDPGFTVLDPAIRPGGALRKATRAVPGPHKWSAPSIYREPRYTKWSRISTCHQEATIPPPSRSPRTAQTEELRADARENRER